MEALRSKGRVGHDMTMSGVHQAWKFFQGPQQEVEFLAKTLIGPTHEAAWVEGIRLFLGSPVYVAQVD